MLPLRSTAFLAFVLGALTWVGAAHAQLDVAPEISAVSRSPALPTSGDTVQITAAVTDDELLVSVELLVDDGSGFVATPMLDDGATGDGLAGDGVFGATIPVQPGGTLVRYYVEATDDFPQASTVPMDAPDGYLAYTVDHEPPAVVINEILASNLATNVDEAAQADDWLELRNRGAFPVALGGMFLTIDLGATQGWELPDFVLAPGERLLLWCDDDENQGARHTNFKLSKEGGEVGLFDTVDHGNVLVHGFAFGPQTTDVSFGYASGEGDAPEYNASPSPELPDVGPRFSDVVINEFLAGSQLPGQDDWIELHNRGGTPADISGWFLSDSTSNPLKYAFPPATVLAPGATLTVGQAQLGFGLSLQGDEVILLTDVDGETSRDYFDYGPQLTDVSQGRFPDGTPFWHLFSPESPGLPNSCAIGVAPLGTVGGLSFVSRTGLVWDEAFDAAAYDVLRGQLGALQTGGAFDDSIETCKAENRTDAEAFDDDDPPDGTAFFYLIRGVNFACGFGSWDGTSPGQVAPRDTGIDASGLACR